MFSQKPVAALAGVLFCVQLLAARPSMAQTAEPAAPAPLPPGVSRQNNEPSQSKSDPAKQDQTKQDQAKQDPANPDYHISRQETKVLFESIDTILQFASNDSKLAIQHEVKKRMTTREDIEKYLNKKLKDDKDAKRMEQSELVLKKFGLLDRSFDLKPFLISLMKEQIAGYYDDKSKTMNLLDWIPPDDQKPVMAHELTHALQDQRVNLEKWNKSEDQKMSKNVHDDNHRIATDEEDTARDAVLEGQAMVTMIDYTLLPEGKNILLAPDRVDALKASMADNTDSPVMARAPLLLQESLIFPYREGLEFERQVLERKGTQVAFGGVLDRPPATSFEILNPDAYLGQVAVPLLTFPDVHGLLDADYVPYDIGVMGQFDVQVLAELFAGPAAAKEITPAWRGGDYYAVQQKSSLKTPASNTEASLAILYVSQWSSHQAALRFAKIYGMQLPRKYSKLTPISGEAAAKNKIAREEKLYDTNEGPALIAVEGDTVVITEGFPMELTRELEAMLFTSAPGRSNEEVDLDGSPQGSPRQLNSKTDSQKRQPTRDLTGALRSLLASAGVYRCALAGMVH